MTPSTGSYNTALYYRAVRLPDGHIVVLAFIVTRNK